MDFLGGVFVMVFGYYASILIYKEEPNILALAAGAIIGRILLIGIHYWTGW